MFRFIPFHSILKELFKLLDNCTCDARVSKEEVDEYTMKFPAIKKQKFPMQWD